MISFDNEIISLAIGDICIPNNIQKLQDSAINAIERGYLKYLPAAGDLELRHSIINKFNDAIESKKNKFTINNIIITAGAKQAINYIFDIIISNHDKVNIILPVPYWAAYPIIINYYKGMITELNIDMSEHTLLDIDILKNSIKKGINLFVLNSPNNPLGYCYSEENLKIICSLLKEYKDLYILYDIVYENLIYDDSIHYNIFNIADYEYWDRIIVINSFSKGYSVTGLRVGYAIGGTNLINKMINIQGITTSSPSSIAQRIALDLFNNGDDIIYERKKTYYTNMMCMYEILSKIKGFKFSKYPSAGMFLLPDISEILYQCNINSDTELCKAILQYTNIKIAPGSKFGMPNHLRIAFTAYDLDILKTASYRIKTFIEDLIYVKKR